MTTRTAYSGEVHSAASFTTRYVGTGGIGGGQLTGSAVFYRIVRFGCFAEEVELLNLFASYSGYLLLVCVMSLPR